MKIAGLIVAAGQGIRAGGDIPKQYQMLGDAPVLRRTVLALLPFVDGLRVVIADGHQDMYAAACGDIRLSDPIIGGTERSDSVLAGLQALSTDAPDIVLIHDAARPFVSPQIVKDLVTALTESQGAYPGIPVVDALWRDNQPVSRDGLIRAQTPQAFRFDAILAAHHAHTGNAKDDVEVAMIAGLSITNVMGDEANFKLTTPADFARAETALSGSDIRTGNGYDVHAFTVGNHVTLCGIDIPHTRSLKGHSDADVAMHAITDAIFGALAEGDIGQWFPPSDPQWKGAASDIFLRKAMERVSERGFIITHIDCTIVCEQPKIGPHAAAMRHQISAITHIPLDRISVKATTSERLGFTGREEGIAAIATATMRKL